MSKSKLNSASNIIFALAIFLLFIGAYIETGQNEPNIRYIVSGIFAAIFCLMSMKK